jgi:hypothetical protein
MNQNRREKIARQRERLEAFRGLSPTVLENIEDAVAGIRDDEHEALDNMPERERMGDVGDRSLEALRYLDMALVALKGIDALLDEIVLDLDRFDRAIEALKTAEKL